MGDQRPGKLSKIGKLLGVSSTNLHKLDNQQQQQKQKQQQQQQHLNNDTLKEHPQSSYSIPSSSSSSINLQHNNTTSHDDLILSQIENDQVSPLPDLKQPQPQSQPQSQSTTLSPHINNNISNTSISSNKASPKLTSTRSHSPVQNLSSTTTSPLSIQSLDQKLKRQQSSSTNIPQVLQNESKPLVSSSSSAKPSPSVSRSSSVRKVPLQSTKSTSNTPIVKKPESISSAQNIAPSLPRFLMLEDGNHEHHLRSAKRQEKLSNMLKDLLGAKKLRDEAKSAVPNLLQGAMQSSTSQLSQQQQQQQSPTSSSQTGKPPTLFAGLVNHVKNNTSPYHQPGTVSPDNSNSNNSITGPDCRSFVEKYGRCQEVIGRGSFGVVRISHKRSDSSNNSEKLYAVKEFKRKPTENEKKYNRRLTSEFCISSSLKHTNIIHTLDLLKDAKGDYCEVMEFCSGGDLYTLIIAAGKLEYAEADCFFKQLIRGVNYMHEMGITHRDLKPENLLLTRDGVLKITDFGNAECFKMAWENEVSFSQGICGSSPYIAPEEFTQESFDPRAVDIWSTGVIYMAMRTGRQLWSLADPNKDEFFQEYLVKRKDSKGYEPIESLKRARCRNVIYSILDPVADRRITGKQILNSEWGREIKCCVD